MLNVSSEHSSKALLSIQHDSLVPIFIEAENIVTMDIFGTTKMSGVDRNSNSLH